MTETNINQLFREGVTAIREGDKKLGRAKLEAVIAQDQLHEEAWLWLSAVVENHEERIICLENVLTINPDNQRAKRGLAKLRAAAQPSPPPAPAEPPPTAHAAPDAIDDGMHAAILGERAPTPRKKPPARESWRDRLYEEDYVSEASLAGSKDLTPLDRTLRDLADVWIDMLIFNVHGGFVDEVQHGGFGHTAISLITAGMLNILATGSMVFMLMVLPATGFQPPLLTTTVNAINEFTDYEINVEANNAYAPAAIITDLLGLPDPATEAARLSDAANAQLELQASRTLARTPLLLASYAVLALPSLFLGMLYYSWVANGVSVFYGGKGNIINTMQALSLGLVATQLAQVPFALLVTLLPLSIALTIGGLFTLYQFYILVVAFSTVHRFDKLGGAGMLIMGGVLAGLLSGLLCGGLFWLIGQIAG